MTVAFFAHHLPSWQATLPKLPSAIALVKKGQGESHIFCSGVPLSAQIALTAAHCLLPYQNKDTSEENSLTVLKREDSPKTVAVLRWITHPQFQLEAKAHSEDYDLAVVKTEPETRTEPSRQSTQSLFCFTQNTPCRGFWILGFSPQRLQLREPQDLIRSPSAWSNIVFNKEIPREGKFLARTSVSQSSAACPGDSGAPVWKIEATQALLVGLVVQANCEKGDVKIVDVNRYAAWIISAAQSLNEVPKLSMAP